MKSLIFQKVKDDLPTYSTAACAIIMLDVSRSPAGLPAVKKTLERNMGTGNDLRVVLVDLVN